MCQLITGAYLGKRIALLEKFSVAEWVRVVKTYGIRRCGLQPAAVRMLLDADLPSEDLGSLDYVISAAGPLDPETRDAFEQRYRVPVLLAYGATEFAGSVCTWTPDLYREFGAAKRASSGRAMPNTEVRIIDPNGAGEVPTGEQGVLEAKIASISPDWIRTNDLASIDADGFVMLHGRADGRSIAADSRSCRRPFAESWSTTRRCATPPSSACTIPGSARCRSRRWRRFPALQHPTRPTSWPWSAMRCPSTTCPSRWLWSRSFRVTNRSRFRFVT